MPNSPKQFICDKNNTYELDTANRLNDFSSFDYQQNWNNKFNTCNQPQRTSKQLHSATSTITHNYDVNAEQFQKNSLLQEYPKTFNNGYLDLQNHFVYVDKSKDVQDTCINELLLGFIDPVVNTNQSNTNTYGIRTDTNAWQNLDTGFNLDFQSIHESSATKIPETDSNTYKNTKDDFFTYEYYKQYLAKDVYNPNINNQKANEQFRQSREKFGLDKEIILDQRQQELVNAVGKKLFPKKFKQYMFDTSTYSYLMNFIDDQLYQYKELLLDEETRSLCSIPVLIPGYVCINKDDSTSVVEHKMNELMNLKIKYIAYNQFFRATGKSNKKDNGIININDKKYKNKFLLVCADKIDTAGKPEILVFIPDYCFDKDMKLIKRISQHNVKLMFFEEFICYPQFEFGLYKFLTEMIDHENSIKTKDNTVRRKSMPIDTGNSQNEINELLVLQDKIIKILERLQSELLNKNLRKNSSSNKRKAKKASDNNSFKKVKFSFENYPSLSDDSKRLKNRCLFQNIESKICALYKEQIDKDVNIATKLIHACGFNNSESLHLLDPEYVQKLKDSAEADIEKYGIEVLNNLKIPVNAIILLPIKHYLYATDTSISKYIKEKELENATINRYHCAYLGKTKKQVVLKNQFNNKVFAALTQHIHIESPFTDNQIIVFFCNNPVIKPDRYSNINLFNPNKFVLQSYFYSNVIMHDDKVGYPLYEFYIDPRFNAGNDDHDVHRSNYIVQMDDIDKTTLEKYLGKSYKEFNQRVTIRAQEYQTRSKEKLI